MFAISFRSPCRVRPTDGLRVVTSRVPPDQAAAHLAALVASSADAIISFAADGTILTWNPGATRLFGFEEEEVIGQSVDLIVPTDLAHEPRDFFEQVRDGRSVAFEAARRQKDGGLVDVAVTLAPIRDASGEIVAVSAVARDVTARKRAEAALRESEARLRRSQEAGGIGSYEWDMVSGDGVQSDGMLRMIGLPPGRRYSLKEIITPVLREDLGAVMGTVSAIGEGALRRETDYRIRRVDDGSVRWIRDTGQLELDADGKPFRWVGIVQDVTERAEAEQRLRESEARLVMAQRAARAVAWEWDLVARTISWADPQTIQELAGQDVPQVIPEEEWFERLHPEDVARRRALGEDAARNGSGVATYRVFRGGELRWLEAVGEVTERASDGRPLRLSGITLDITDRKRVEERLRESETRLRLAIDAAHLAIWESDLATGEVRGSPQLNRLLGFPEGAPLDAETIRARYLPGEDQRIAEAGRAAMSHPERFAEVEFRYAVPNGSTRWLMLRAQAQVHAGAEPRGFVGVMMDITERKRWEDHQRLLIDELNHRVKNTLAIVQGIAQQTFVGERFPADVRQAFEGRLSALAAAHNLLTRQNWEAASIRQVVADTVAAVGPRTGQVRIDGPDLLMTPKAAVSLAMAVHELATNAVKYGSLSEPGGRVEVGWRTADDRLKLEWREHGGPAVVPPRRRGFGTRMIERGLAAELDGRVAISFLPEGLVCSVDAPLPRAGA
jgi:PAS domain S-box-containing protein